MTVPDVAGPLHLTQTAGVITATNLGLQGRNINSANYAFVAPTSVAFTGTNFTWAQGTVVVGGAAVSTVVAASGAGNPLQVPAIAPNVRPDLAFADAIAGITDAGNLSLTANGVGAAPIGTITQSAFANVNVTGTTTLQATNSITLANLPVAPGFPGSTFNPVVVGTLRAGHNAVGGGIGVGPNGNDFGGALSATVTAAGEDITLNDRNTLTLGNGLIPGGLTTPTAAGSVVDLTVGINAGASLIAEATAAIAQNPTGAITTHTLTVAAGGDVLLNQLVGGFGINQITNLGAVSMAGAGSDFVLFDQGGGLNLTASIGSSGGVKIVTTGGMTVNGIVNVATGAPLSITGDDTPAGYGMVLLANHNSVPGIVGGPNNFQVQTGSFSATGSLGVIYVDTQSASTLGNFVPLNFSPNTVFVGTTNNNLNFVNAGSTQWVLGIAGPLEVNDQAGQLNIDDLFKKLMEMADPARGAKQVTVDKGRRKQLNALMAAFKQSRSKGVIDPFSFGPLQFLGYDFQDLMEAGYGTPAYDPSKVGNETPKSILDGLPLTNQ